MSRDHHWLPPTKKTQEAGRNKHAAKAVDDKGSSAISDLLNESRI